MGDNSTLGYSNARKASPWDSAESSEALLWRPGVTVCIIGVAGASALEAHCFGRARECGRLMTRTPSTGLLETPTRVVHMNRLHLMSVALVAALAASGVTSFAMAQEANEASIRRITGLWVNTDSNSGSVIRLDFRRYSQDPPLVAVHPWGACHPNPCDWGSHPVSGTAFPLQSVVDAGFKVTTLTFAFQDSLLRVHVHATFRGKRPRPPQSETLLFRKKS